MAAFNPPQRNEVYRMPDGPERLDVEADWTRTWFVLAIFEEIQADLQILNIHRRSDEFDA